MGEDAAMVGFRWGHGRFLRQAFGLSRGEARGYTVLVLLMIISLATPWLIRRYSAGPPDHLADTRLLDSLYALLTAPPDTAIVLFPFNPNKISEDSLLLLGFPQHLATRMVRYRSAGGRFAGPESLMRIYGMDSALARRLGPWVESDAIAGTERSTRPGIVSAIPERLDLNQVDFGVLNALLGQNRQVVNRVLRFREALGGFISPEQLAEVYDMDSVSLALLLPRVFVHPDFVPEKININTASAGELAAHPYISRDLAEAILTYRSVNGNIRDRVELSAFRVLTAEKLDRLQPYLEF
jgi:competence protein ComEA